MIEWSLVRKSVVVGAIAFFAIVALYYPTMARLESTAEQSIPAGEGWQVSEVSSQKGVPFMSNTQATATAMLPSPSTGFAPLGTLRTICPGVEPDVATRVENLPETGSITCERGFQNVWAVVSYEGKVVSYDGGTRNVMVSGDGVPRLRVVTQSDSVNVAGFGVPVWLGVAGMFGVMLTAFSCVYYHLGFGQCSLCRAAAANSAGEGLV